MPEKQISIHAPRAGSDVPKIETADELEDFNPRSPCGERLRELQPIFDAINFNPRSPCGERPIAAARSASLMVFQSTLPVRGATRLGVFALHLPLISIHAPRAGSDNGGEIMTDELRHFNPRSPCGERHYSALDVRTSCEISIHAPRAGSDGALTQVLRRASNFNPRSPCGERRQNIILHGGSLLFQSTLPVRGATWCLLTGDSARLISIHAPRAGSDPDDSSRCH